MLKRFLLISILLQTSCVFAAVQLKVTAIDEFKTDSPSDFMDVIVAKESILGDYTIKENSILHCDVIKIVEPKRGKRNATFFVKPDYYISDDKVVKFEEELYGKYSKTVLSKEELKNIKPFNIVKKAGLIAGNFFIKGFSIAYSFAEGVVKNENDNHLKSGVVNAYESTPISYIEVGEQLDIQKGDSFYLIFKPDKEKSNYSYTTNEDAE